MNEGMTPGQFQILREDFQAMRLEFNLRLDRLVTQDSFLQEQKRVDALIQSLNSDVGDVRESVGKEVQARVAERQDALKTQLNEKNEREKIRRQTLWQWFALAASLVGGPLIGGLIGAALASSGIGAP